jgi:diketogulonate reductase-like aldo/keto reductase
VRCGACETSLRKLGLDAVDLYLLHQPMPSEWERTVAAYRAAEKLLEDGRVRAIGVSNFSSKHLEELHARSHIVPAVNQVELHPFFVQRELRDAHARFGIATQAWSPIGGVNVCMPRDSIAPKNPLTHPVVVALAEKYQRTPAQVVLRWHLEHGFSAIPKSVKPARIAENFDVFGFKLTSDDVAAIDALDTGVRGGPDPERSTRRCSPTRFLTDRGPNVGCASVLTAERLHVISQRSAPLYRSSIVVYVALAGVLATAVHATAQALKDVQVADTPLVLKAQGSFFVGGEKVEQTQGELGDLGPGGHITVNQMYVRYMVPQGGEGNVPVVMVHGATLTGKSWETTPDGRMGWDEYFVRKGHPVYVPDQVGRGRSGFNQAVFNNVRAGLAPANSLPRWLRFSDEGVWPNFRFGAKPDTPSRTANFLWPLSTSCPSKACPTSASAACPQPTRHSRRCRISRVR